MNVQSHLMAFSKHFLSLVLRQPHNLEPHGSSLTGTREHLLKDAWEGTITRKPAVETNVIHVRLNFISLKTWFLPTEKSACHI